MTNNTKVRLILLTFAVVCVGTIYFKNAKWQELHYDWKHNNPTKLDKARIDSILNTFKFVDIDALPEKYKESSGLNDAKYQKLISNLKFYVVSKKECNLRLLGKHRVKEFICKDARWDKVSYFSDEKLYLGIDKRILYRLLRLKERLKRLGYNQDGFTVKSGHRTPYRNKKIGGASQSRHIVGEALDLKIEDINNDGEYTPKDKKIVLDLCENHIIRNMGGIGLYPNTNIVHIDVRGYRARWNKY